MSVRPKLSSKVPKAKRSNPRRAMSAKTKLPASAPARRRISFTLSAPDARNVKLAGDFTGWEDAAREMTRQSNGSWKTTVTVAPGQHEYRFIVDGQWVDDPRCDVRKPNPFGGENCTRVVE
jgi:1,4-alpha-glucan branching enzyme